LWCLTTPILGTWFWKSKDDAQQYHRERNQQIVKMTRPLVTGPPVVENFTVEITTSREIAASRAA
jgi:hypothetical protein